MEHIRRVQQLMGRVVAQLVERARLHDRSKLEEPEVTHFANVTAELKGLTYGSDEYKAVLAGPLKYALQHHYRNNSHHPEHYPNGVAGMSLLDLIEMIVDWKAASERHADGDIKESLRINRERFEVGEQLQSILENTVRELFPAMADEWRCFGCGAGGCTFNFCYQCGAGRKDYDASN